jgi:hypothetical protein
MPILSPGGRVKIFDFGEGGNPLRVFLSCLDPTNHLLYKLSEFEHKNKHLVTNFIEKVSQSIVQGGEYMSRTQWSDAIEQQQLHLPVAAEIDNPGNTPL